MSATALKNFFCLATSKKNAVLDCALYIRTLQFLIQQKFPIGNVFELNLIFTPFKSGVCSGLEIIFFKSLSATAQNNIVSAFGHSRENF